MAHPVQITAAALGTLVGFVVYLFLHEGVHGMHQVLHRVPAQYGFGAASGHGLCEQPVLFRRTAYMIIALAPIVVWGIVLTPAAARYGPEQSGWYLYAIQIFNVSGAAGDLFVTYRILTMPKDAGSGYRHGDEIFRADAFCLKRIEAGSPLALDNG